MDRGGNRNVGAQRQEGLDKGPQRRDGGDAQQDQQGAGVEQVVQGAADGGNERFAPHGLGGRVAEALFCLDRAGVHRWIR